LDLDNEYSTTLYELDNNKEKQNKIMELIPNIRKYFSYKNVIGIANPEKCKRPYFSIIKFILHENSNSKFIVKEIILQYNNQLTGEIPKEIGHRRALHFGATFVES